MMDKRVHLKYEWQSHPRYDPAIHNRWIGLCGAGSNKYYDLVWGDNTQTYRVGPHSTLINTTPNFTTDRSQVTCKVCLERINKEKREIFAAMRRISIQSVTQKEYQAYWGQVTVQEVMEK